MIFPTDQPAGTLATRIAGSAELEAILQWRSPGDMPARTDILGAVTRELADAGDRGNATRTLRAEITGLTLADIGAALEDALRGITAYAALTEAVLETRAIHGPPPRVVPAALLEPLARDLHDAGFTVRFAPSLTPAPDVGVTLGMHGAEKELMEFVDAHPEWELA